MIDERKEFAKMLDSIVIPSTLTFDQQSKVYENLQKETNKIIPHSLYRFRSCNENNISAFNNDEMWVSTADCMNDGFDSRLFYDKNAIKEWQTKIIGSDISRDDFFKAINSNDMPSELIQVKNSLESLSQEQFKQMIQQAMRLIFDETYFAEKMLPTIAQKTIKFCCLSERINSAYMWGLYSSNESGFALEYSFKDYPIVEQMGPGKSRNCFIFPVIYNDQRYKVSEEYVEYLFKYRLMNRALHETGLWNSNPDFWQSVLNLIPCPDMSIATKISLHKSIEWEKETEWRMFCTSSDDVEFNNEKHGFCKKKPERIYLGRRISPINEKILVGLAKEKGVPVYKMKLEDELSTYSLTSIQIQ